MKSHHYGFAHVFRIVIAIYLALCLQVLFCPQTVVLSQANEPYPPTHSSTEYGHTTVYESGSVLAQHDVQAASTTDILLIQTSDPWERDAGTEYPAHYVGNSWFDGITADTEVLSQLGYSYQIATWADISSGLIDIFSYPVVLIVNDQVQSFYDQYANQLSSFERYVTNGGTLVFFAASDGWAEGTLNALLPGGMSVINAELDSTGESGPGLEEYNYIADFSHPIVTRQLSEDTPLTTDDLYSDWCSHGYFENVPENADVILTESHGYPTLVEYSLGNGRVIASTQTWEHNWSYHVSEEDEYGNFARKALDDVFLYAFSSGTKFVDNLSIDLRIEDAPDDVMVNKSAGSYVDIVAKITGDEALNPSVELRVFNEAIPAPIKSFTRKLTDNTGYREFTSQALGDGRYRTLINLETIQQDDSSNSIHYKEVVWRFRLPNDIQPQNVTVQATITINGAVIDDDTDAARFRIVPKGEALIVTDRSRLFENYESSSQEISELLAEAYRSAESVIGEVFYIDREGITWEYNSDINNVNEISRAIDQKIEQWFQRLSSAEDRPQYLMLVGGDSIVPFYRMHDKDYTCQFFKGIYRVCENNNWLNETGDLITDLIPNFISDYDYTHMDWVELYDPEQPDLVIKAYADNYFFSDNIYADVGGNLDDWERGELELSTGRIIGATASDMRMLISNGQTHKKISDSAFIIGLKDSEFHINNILRGRLKQTVKHGVDTAPQTTGGVSWSEDDFHNIWERDVQLHLLGVHSFPYGFATGNKDTVRAKEIRAGGLQVNNPLIMSLGCNFLVPSKQSLSERLVQEGASGLIGSLGLVNGGAKIQYNNSVGARFFEQVVENIFTPVNSNNGAAATALLTAKQNYPWYFIDQDWWVINHAGANEKTVLEFVYYGVPWTRYTIDTEDRNEIIAADKLRHNITEAPVRRISFSQFEQTLTLSVGEYYLENIDGYDLLYVDGADTFTEVGIPALPFETLTIDLPPDAEIESIEIVSENSVELGKRDIPSVAPLTTYDDLNSSLTAISSDITGVFPPERLLFEVDDYDNKKRVQISIAYAQLDTNTDTLALFEKSEIKIRYSTNSAIFVSDVGVIESILPQTIPVETNIQVSNVSDANQSVSGELVIHDVFGNIVATVDVPATVIPASSSNNIAVTWPSDLSEGQYYAEATLTNAEQVLGDETPIVSLLSGRILELSAPEEIASGQYGNFSVQFENYQTSDVTAKATIALYDEFGVEVGRLLQREFSIIGTGVAGTSWSWTLEGIPEGRYYAKAFIDTGNSLFSSEAQTFTVVRYPSGFGGSSVNYLPMLMSTGKAPIATESGLYSLNIEIEGQGSVSTDPNSVLYNQNQAVTLSAIPRTDWKFLNWSGDLNGNTNPVTVIIDNNKNISAQFVRDESDVLIPTSIPTATPTNTPRATNSPTPTQTPSPNVITENILGNGDFEAGSNGVWTENSAQFSGTTDILILELAAVQEQVVPHSGSYAVWLGGTDLEVGSLAQSVAIPSSVPVTLSYFYQIRAQDECGRDFVTVSANSTIVKIFDLCSSTESLEWQQDIIDLSSYAGQFVTLSFSVTTDDFSPRIEDASASSNFFLDDVSVTAGTNTRPTATSTPEATLETPSPTSVPTSTSVPVLDSIDNGGFEDPASEAWIEDSTAFGGKGSLITSATALPRDIAPYEGSHVAWLGGENEETSLLIQEFTLPSNAESLAFYYQTRSEDNCGYDVASVLVNQINLVDFQVCVEEEANEWTLQMVDIHQFAGQPVNLTFRMLTDVSNISAWFIDYVVVTTTEAGEMVRSASIDLAPLSVSQELSNLALKQESTGLSRMNQNHDQYQNNQEAKTARIAAVQKVSEQSDLVLPLADAKLNDIHGRDLVQGSGGATTLHLESGLFTIEASAQSKLFIPFFAD